MQFKVAIVAVVAAAGIALATGQSACAAEKLTSLGTGAINGVYYPLGGMYKGTDQAQAAFGVFDTVVLSVDLPESTAYLVTTAVFDNFEEFELSHPALANISKESILLGNTAPLHTGAIRYFRERGLIK